MKLYPNIINNAKGDNRKHVVFIKYVDPINNKQFIITKIRADFAFIFPLGISLDVDVLGFLESDSLSKYLLKPIAADLAKIMHKITYVSIIQSKSCDFVARKNPINANGIAKIE